MTTAAEVHTWGIRNDETGEIHNLGPMYRGTRAWTTRKLEAEHLPYPWTLVAEPDMALQRGIWESRCPELLKRAELAEARAELADLLLTGRWTTIEIHEAGLRLQRRGS